MGVWFHNGVSKVKRIVNGTELTIHRRYWKKEIGDLEALRRLYFFTKNDGKLVCPWIICYKTPIVYAGCDLRAESTKKPHGNARKPTALSTAYVSTQKTVLEEIDNELFRIGSSISEVF